MRARTMATAASVALFVTVRLMAAAPLLDPSPEASPTRILLRTASFDTNTGTPAAPTGWTGNPLDPLRLVQFDPAVSYTDRLAALKSVGAKIGPYLPNNAYLVSVPIGASLDNLRGVVWTGPWQPAWRVAPEMPGSPAATAASVAFGGVASGGSGRPIAKATFFPGTDEAAIRASLAAAGVREPEVASDPDNPVARFEMPASPLAALAAIPGLVWLEPEPEYTTFNDRTEWILQSNISGSKPIWDHNIKGSGQIVGLMDTGIDRNHCCFQTAGKIVAYRTYGGGDTGATCSNDHGTHVSGTVACDYSTATYDGVAVSAKLTFGDIQAGGLSCLSGSVSPPASLITPFTDSRNDGARTHSNSWGGGGNVYSSYSTDVDTFMWNNQDFLIFFAMGNAGGAEGSGTVQSPATAKNLVSVGGTQSSPAQTNLYDSSSRGPVYDGRRKPEIVAPATGPNGGSPQITSAQSATTCSFVGFSGTSMATPASAASAALVREYFTDGFYPTGAAVPANAFQPTAALVKAVLMASAADLTGANDGGDRPNNSQGFGRILLHDALPFTGDAQKMRILDDRNSATGFTASGQSVCFPFKVNSSTPALRAFLVWTDAPSTPGAAVNLVNDLDLEMRHAGTAYLGSGAFSGGWSLAAGSADRRNTNEAVLLQTPDPGAYAASVKAFAINNVAAHPQDYAMVVIGDVAAADPLGAVGNTERETKALPDVKLSWAVVTGADHYHVYRGTTPNFMSSHPPVYVDNAIDQDPVTPGVQWTDLGAAGDSTSYFYIIKAADACHTEEP